MSKVSPQMMANAIRALAMDAVQKAKSGHPGMPMGMADIATALWSRHLRFNPADPKWLGRDRFILSNGHGSMLQYALLHLTGYDLSMDDLKAFRQLGSKTPGHPEVHVTPGVETTTGPLGQGIANGVGMALAEKLLGAEFNREGFPVIDNRTYVFLGDGCLMEGISHEVCSLAGVWHLNKLIAIYDDNGISIDGDVRGWFQDDTRKRFEAYGWMVIGPVDGHDIDAMDRAIAEAKTSEDKPVLIIAKTTIGKGSPNRQGTAKVHGEALGDEEIAATKAALGWNYGPFEIPEEVYEAWDHREAGKAVEAEWDKMYAAYEKAYPKEAAELARRLAGDLPENWDEVVMDAVCAAEEAQETVATRKASQKALNALAPALPELLGGSADLTGSNLTNWKDVKSLNTGDFHARHISYGVREFGMSAILNGIALFGGFIPYGATFLTFSDYSRNALRMSALMNLRAINVFTHDSIGLGEDGPTHQSVEHIPSLRLIPGMDVWRPADTVETVVAWASAIERRDGASCLIFSRQNLPFVDRDEVDADAIAMGGYVAAEAPLGKGEAQVILLATGSEVGLAMEARAKLAALNIQARVVSMPCTSRFDRQTKEYRESILTPGTPVLAMEASRTDLWWKYFTGRGDVLGVDTFGESAPAKDLWQKFGFTVENVVAKVEGLLK
ncbi:transketolase [Sutterella faecalis]|uniref:Transketolase n=2 Tax=Sutterella TaxID=40544 RepID=A0AAI9SE60_9BURK|nr:MULTISPECIES: transketolase [Sutterella]KAB7652418.1 transketolase [Sutterella seckii]QDA55118.1 transketolase [Sutterella faecalis]